MKIRFVTLGCKLNIAESSALGRSLLASGHTRAEDGEQADICVLNTCTVTDAADRKCRQALSRLRRENPNAVIIVTGCYAQLTAELPKPKGLEDADYVLGNEAKFEIPELVERISGQQQSAVSGQPIVQSTPIREVEAFHGALSFSSTDSEADETHTTAAELPQRTRSFLTVRDACNYF